MVITQANAYYTTNMIRHNSQGYVAGEWLASPSRRATTICVAHVREVLLGQGARINHTSTADPKLAAEVSSVCMCVCVSCMCA